MFRAFTYDVTTMRGRSGEVTSHTLPAESLDSVLRLLDGVVRSPRFFSLSIYDPTYASPEAVAVVLSELARIEFRATERQARLVEHYSREALPFSADALLLTKDSYRAIEKIIS